MNALASAHRIWSQLEKHFGIEDMKPVMQKLPSGIRQMGLVRCVEALGLGKHQRLGKRLFQELAVTLGLDPDIERAVAHLETCSRRDLFRYQRSALDLFDALSTIHRIEEHL